MRIHEALEHLGVGIDLLFLLPSSCFLAFALFQVADIQPDLLHLSIISRLLLLHLVDKTTPIDKVLLS